MRKNMKKTSRAVAAASIAALVTTLGVAATEQSASAGGYLWVFNDADFGGSSNYFYDKFPDLSHINYTYGGGPMNDTITSIDNDTDTPWCFYGDANYKHYLFAVEAHTKVANVGNWDNDQISSFMGVTDSVYCPQEG
jgi:hypothetical protein